MPRVAIIVASALALLAPAPATAAAAADTTPDDNTPPPEEMERLATIARWRSSANARMHEPILDCDTQTSHSLDQGAGCWVCHPPELNDPCGKRAEFADACFSPAKLAWQHHDHFLHMESTDRVRWLNEKEAARYGLSKEQADAMVGLRERSSRGVLRGAAHALGKFGKKAKGAFTYTSDMKLADGDPHGTSRRPLYPAELLTAGQRAALSNLTCDEKIAAPVFTRCEVAPTMLLCDNLRTLVANQCVDPLYEEKQQALRASEAHHLTIEEQTLSQDSDNITLKMRAILEEIEELQRTIDSQPRAQQEESKKKGDADSTQLDGKEENQMTDDHVATRATHTADSATEHSAKVAAAREAKNVALARLETLQAELESNKLKRLSLETAISEANLHLSSGRQKRLGCWSACGEQSEVLSVEHSCRPLEQGLGLSPLFRSVTRQNAGESAVATRGLCPPKQMRVLCRFERNSEEEVAKLEAQRSLPAAEEKKDDVKEEEEEKEEEKTGQVPSQANPAEEGGLGLFAWVGIGVIVVMIIGLASFGALKFA